MMFFGALPVPPSDLISAVQAGSARSLDSEIARARAAMAIPILFVIAVAPTSYRRQAPGVLQFKHPVGPSEPVQICAGSTPDDNPRRSRWPAVPPANHRSQDA